MTAYQPLMYDLCCGGGGVTRAALDLGFRVIGVDIVHNPDYPGDFILADALHAPLKSVADLVWASPYCQGYSTLRFCNPKSAKPRQVNEFREVCRRLGRDYVIENVNTCHDLRDPVKLCGAHFGLPIRRWRSFECSFTVPQPARCHPLSNPVRLAGNFGGGAKRAAAAMYLPVMSRKSLSQAVPYPYTLYILRWYLASRRFP